jgi:acyl dehydratase
MSNYKNLPAGRHLTIKKNKKMKNDFTIGQQAQIIKTFDENEVMAYTKCSGDTNPIHFDQKYAKSTIFKDRIVPGLQVASLFGGLLGSELPGEGTIHLGQTVSFKKPVYINEQVLAVIEIVNIRTDKPIITFKTICYKANNEIAIEGEAVVKII